MTNFEIYKDEILDILQKTGGLFAFDTVDDAIRSCEETPCGVCLFNDEDEDYEPCFRQRKKWLESTGRHLSKYKILKRDTPVCVWNADRECAITAHFYDILEATEEDIVRVYAKGKTSYTSNGELECYRHMEIVKKGEE